MLGGYSFAQLRRESTSSVDCCPFSGINVFSMPQLHRYQHLASVSQESLAAKSRQFDAGWLIQRHQRPQNLCRLFMVPGWPPCEGTGLDLMPSIRAFAQEFLEELCSARRN